MLHEKHGQSETLHTSLVGRTPPFQALWLAPPFQAFGGDRCGSWCKYSRSRSAKLDSSQPWYLFADKASAWPLASDEQGDLSDCHCKHPPASVCTICTSWQFCRAAQQGGNRLGFAVDVGAYGAFTSTSNPPNAAKPSHCPPDDLCLGLHLKSGYSHNESASAGEKHTLLTVEISRHQRRDLPVQVAPGIGKLKLFLTNDVIPVKESTAKSSASCRPAVERKQTFRRCATWFDLRRRASPRRNLGPIGISRQADCKTGTIASCIACCLVRVENC